MVQQETQQQDLENIAALLLTSLEFPAELENLFGGEERQIAEDIFSLRRSLYMAPEALDRTSFSRPELDRLYRTMERAPLPWMYEFVSNLRGHEVHAASLANPNSRSSKAEMEGMMLLSKHMLISISNKVMPVLNNASAYMIQLLLIGTWNNYFIPYIAPELEAHKIDLNEWPTVEEVMIMQTRFQQDNNFKNALEIGEQPKEHDIYQSAELIDRIMQKLKRGDNIHVFAKKGSRLFSNLQLLLAKFDNADMQIHGIVTVINFEDGTPHITITSPFAAALTKLSGNKETPDEVIKISPEDVSTIIVDEKIDFNANGENYQIGQYIYYYGLDICGKIFRCKAEILGNMGGHMLLMNITPENPLINNTITARPNWEVFKI